MTKNKIISGELVASLLQDNVRLKNLLSERDKTIQILTNKLYGGKRKCQTIK